MKKNSLIVSVLGLAGFLVIAAFAAVIINVMMWQEALTDRHMYEAAIQGGTKMMLPAEK